MSKQGNVRNGDGISEKPSRKKDSRSVRTEGKIKESLLRMLGSRRFADITVSEICRKAGITRATFYQHYASLADVLDQLLEDVTQELGDVPMEMCESCTSVGERRAEGRIWTGMPFCHFYASKNPYRVLLDDSAISERLIERIVDRGLDKTIATLQSRLPNMSVDVAQLRYFNIFRMSGCLAAVKASRRNGYDWSMVQPTLDSAIAAALETL